MVKRIITIVFIFLATSVAWGVLGTTIFSRTYSSVASLEGRVVSTWGAPHNQSPPTAFSKQLVPKTEESLENGKKVVRTIQEEVTNLLPLESSQVTILLDLEPRQKGLLWYNTYKVTYAGVYAFRNTTDQDKVTFSFTLPTSQAIYDDLVFALDDTPLVLTNQQNAVVGSAHVPSGKTVMLKVAYRSQGLNEWCYSFGSDISQIRNFALKMTTNFKGFDFADNTLSPSEKYETDTGWELVWAYNNLVSGHQISMVMPEKLQPGPLAGQISFFAPVSLFFFFFLIFIITTLRGIELHPMNYFFLAGAFFAFHLLLAYLVDHISIHIAFVICSGVSIFLVVSYLRLVVGLRFAAGAAGLVQFFYLVMFSYAFFYKGFTGLAITIGSILTLFVVMQMTGRIKWAEKFERKTSLSPEQIAALQNQNH